MLVGREHQLRCIRCGCPHLAAVGLESQAVFGRFSVFELRPWNSSPILSRIPPTKDGHDETVDVVPSGAHWVGAEARVEILGDNERSAEAIDRAATMMLEN
jgi:hypothetical protein